MSKILMQRQTGAVLAISLVFLLIMTIIGITAAQNAGLEEKMAGNLRDHNLAFQAAETALRAAEEETSNFSCPITLAAAVGGRYAHASLYGNTGVPNIGDGAGNVWATPNAAYTYEGNNLSNTTSTAQPKFIIQCINSTVSATSLYRVIARGTGGTTDAVVILQSVYSR